MSQPTPNPLCEALHHYTSIHHTCVPRQVGQMSHHVHNARCYVPRRIIRYGWRFGKLLNLESIFSCRTITTLQSHLELGQPLLLEVARYLSGPAADTSCDPAFSAYHALLQLDGAAEELQEVEAVSVAGCAVPIGCMTWALQQGKVATAGLPPGPTPSRWVT